MYIGKPIPPQWLHPNPTNQGCFNSWSKHFISTLNCVGIIYQVLGQSFYPHEVPVKSSSFFLNNSAARRLIAYIRAAGKVQCITSLRIFYFHIPKILSCSYMDRRNYRPTFSKLFSIQILTLLTLLHISSLLSLSSHTLSIFFQHYVTSN